MFSNDVFARVEPKGLGRHIEVRKILGENKIEIFGLMEIKLRIDKQRGLIIEFSKDWSIITNINGSNLEIKDSIWVGCKRF